MTYLMLRYIMYLDNYLNTGGAYEEKSIYSTDNYCSVFCAVFCVYGYMTTLVEGMPFVARVVFMAIPAVMIIVMICTLIERIKEIRKGENDDLGKY